ncbi:Heterokaryon incompatibility protein 6, OR allele, partial [Madurella mycetomatis]
MYEPLDPSRREIRLLRIEGGSYEGPIRCSLYTVSLDEVDLEFAALSYVWGDESMTKDVLVNNHLRAVTTNLESALQNFWHFFKEHFASTEIRSSALLAAAEEPNGLKALRRYLASKDCNLHHESDADEGVDSEEGEDLDEDDIDCTGLKLSVKDWLLITRVGAVQRRARVGGGVLPIWVDALCINQDDPVEKSHQIPMMRDIYAKAICTFSWLGPPDHRRIDLAMNLIRKLAVRFCRRGYSRSQLNKDHPELCEFDQYRPPFNKYWEVLEPLRGWIWHQDGTISPKFKVIEMKA